MKKNWIYLPDLIRKRSNHASVSIGNKMFVVGGYNNSSIEMFESFSRKFTLLNLPSSSDIYHFTVQAISVGYKIVIFSMYDTETTVFTYDIINNQWCNLGERVLENLTDISCVKYSTC